MIRYALNCAEWHRFEAWFASATAFDSQQEAGEIACPQCGSSAVSKALMAPAVASSDTPADMRLSAHPPADVAAAMRTIRNHLKENAEYVGDRFASEARRIHFDEAEKRGIYGEATPQDVRGLIEDGVEFHPLPTLPEDHN